MLVRFLSALVLIPFLLFCVHYGGIYMFIFLCGAALIGIYEMTHVFQKKGYRVLQKELYFFTFLTFILLFSKAEIGKNYNMTPFLLVLGAIYMIRKKLSVEELGLNILSYLYISISLSYIFKVELISHSYVWFIFILAYATDTFAYFSGKLFGRRKLIPQISPNKTIEGAVGGIIGAVVSCEIYIFYLGETKYIIPIIGVAIVGSIISQIGDLFASAIKRLFEVKDYGKLIPGHGGVLDRIDSVLFTAPFVYYAFVVIKIFIK
jgi:cytidylyltransferase family